MIPLLIAICQNIGDARQRLGLSHRQVSQRSGIPLYRLYEIESFRATQISMKEIEALAKGCEAKLSDIFPGTEAFSDGAIRAMIEECGTGHRDIHMLRTGHFPIPLYKN